MKTSRFKSLLVPALFVAVVVGIFFELFFKGYIALPADTLVGAYFPWLDYKWGYSVGVPVKNALLSDSFSHFYIYKNLVADLLKQGVIPLWNKYSIGGAPLLATYHTNPFFPANFLLLLPKITGWNLFIFSSTLCAGLSMYLYLSFRIKSKVARFIGSFVFAFFGPMTTWSEFGTAVWAAAIIPLILLSLDLYVIRRKAFALPLFGVLVAFLIFAGHVQLDTYVAAILPVYILFLLTEKDRKFSIIDFLKIIMFGFIGVGLTLVQLLPTADLLAHSIRGAENYASSFHYGLVEFPQLIRLWLADFFGHPSTQNQWGEYIYHEYSSFVGTLTLPFVFALLLSKNKSRFQKLFLGMFFTSLFLVSLNPISNFLFSQPLPLLTYSSASRLFFVTGLCVSVLLAESLDRYLREQISRSSILITSISMLALTAVALFYTPSLNFSVALRNSIIPIALLLLLVGAVISPLKRKYIILFLAVIFIFDLARYYRKYNPFVPARLAFPQTPVLQYVQNQPGIFRIAREKTNLLTPNSWAYYGLESVEGYEPLRPLGYSRFFHLLENGKYFNAASRYSELEDVSPKYLSAMNVQYFFIVDSKEPTVIQNKLFASGFKRVFTDHSVSVLENPNVSPRAYFVQKIINVVSDEELAKNLESVNFQPKNMGVVFGESGQEFMPTTIPNLVEHLDNKVVITTNDPKEQFLVLADNFDTGWKAYIDDKEAKIIRTNGSLRGLHISPGNHEIVMNYLPSSFTTGVKLSTISLLLLLLAGGFVIYGQRSTRKVQ